jgi:hypothetical protein
LNCIVRGEFRYTGSVFGSVGVGEFEVDVEESVCDG